jgi:hypothetical protein
MQTLGIFGTFCPDFKETFVVVRQFEFENQKGLGHLNIGLDCYLDV